MADKDEENDGAVSDSRSTGSLRRATSALTLGKTAETSISETEMERIIEGDEPVRFKRDTNFLKTTCACKDKLGLNPSQAVGLTTWCECKNKLGLTASQAVGLTTCACQNKLGLTPSQAVGLTTWCECKNKLGLTPSQAVGLTTCCARKNKIGFSISPLPAVGLITCCAHGSTLWLTLNPLHDLQQALMETGAADEGPGPSSKPIPEATREQWRRRAQSDL